MGETLHWKTQQIRDCRQQPVTHNTGLRVKSQRNLRQHTSTKKETNTRWKTKAEGGWITSLTHSPTQLSLKLEKWSHLHQN